MNTRKLMAILLIIAGVLLIAIVALLIIQQQPAAAPNVPDEVTITPPPGLETVTPPPQVTLPPSASVPDASASAEDVLRYYFDRWSARDQAGMDACLIEADRGKLAEYDDLPSVASVELLSLTEQPSDQAKSQFDPAWYENPADVALYTSSYKIHYNEAGQEMHEVSERTRQDYLFWLVKETAEGGWRIALQGY